MKEYDFSRLLFLVEICANLGQMVCLPDWHFMHGFTLRQAIQVG